MKLLIASDLHGSAYYTQMIIDAFYLHQCDKITLLGDILYHGPRNDLPRDYSPKKVIPLLNALKTSITACRGNCDSEVDQMVLEFPIMKDYETIQMEDYQIYLSHGHVYSEDNLPTNIQQGDVFVSGHTHIPTMKLLHGIHILNPGSASIPKGESKHSYGVMEEHTFTLYDENHVLLDQYKLQ